MLWLLPYVGWTLAASAVASAAGYAAVTQFSVVQRVLAAALGRALAKLAKSEDGRSNYTVEHTETGVIATGVVVNRALLAAAQGQSTRVAALSIQRLEVDFPSLSSPVTIKIHGVRAALQQLQLPAHISPEARAEAERAANREEKRLRLEVVEELLWGPREGRAATRRWNPAGAYLGRLQARAMQKSLAFVAQLLEVEVTDVEVTYTQRGEPGPRPCLNHLQGADAAVLHVRELSLTPQGGAGARLRPEGPGEDGAAASGASTPMASPRKPLPPQHPPPASEDGDKEPTWWDALGSLPNLLWSNVVITRPSAARLAVTGVSLTLKTYPSLWQGYAAAHRPPAEAPPGPFAFSPGAWSGAKRRRRKGAVAERLDAAGGPAGAAPSPAPSPPSSAAASPSKPSAPGSAPSTPRPDAPWVDHAEALRSTPCEEHVIFRQWEFSVMLCLLPPGYDTAEHAQRHPGGAAAAAAAAGAGAPAAPAAPLPTVDEGVPDAAESGVPLFSRRPSLGRRSTLSRSVSGFDSVASGDGDRRALEHIVSGGFEDFDAETELAGEDLSPIASPRAPIREDEALLQHAGSSLVAVELRHDEEEDEEFGSPRGRGGGDSSGDEFATPAASLAPSRASSRDASPERASSFAVEAVNGAAEALNGNGKHAPPPPTTDASPASSSQPSQAAAAAAPVPPLPRPAAASSAPPPSTSSSPSKEGCGAAASAASAFTVDLSVSLKALILEVNPAVVGIVSRLADRQAHYSSFGDHWEMRPQAPVAGHEAAWWQHGGRALAARTRRLARREVPLDALELRRAARVEYQALYAAARAAHPLFVDPGRRWWHLRAVRAVDEAARKRLEEFEEALSLEELTHFRLGVAARHCRPLREDEALLLLAADKVDALVYTRRGGMPPGLADLLLHRDRAGGGAAAPAGKGATRFGLRVAVACPKLGLAMDMRPHAAAPPPEGLQHVVFAVLRVGAELDADGSIGLRVESVDCGEAAASTGQLDPRVLACPSSVCERVCHAAEFTRYAVAGAVTAQSVGARQDVAVAVRIAPRYGVGGRAVGDVVVAGGGGGGAPGDAPAPEDSWHPAGFDVDVALAAVGVVYHAHIASGMLGVLEAAAACRMRPWAWAAPGAAAGPEAPAWPPPLPPNPVTVSEMVENAFAVAHEPVLGRLVLPSTGLVIRCPGVAVQLPYRHKNSADVFKAAGRRRATRRLRGGEDGGDGAAAAALSSPAAAVAAAKASPRSPAAAPAAATGASGSAPGADDEGAGGAGGGEGVEDAALVYMFTVTLQNIEVSVAGEDFHLSLRGGTARRVEAFAFLDVFSYLSRASRRVLARHIMPTRVLFDPTHRRFTEEVAGVDALEAQLREIELAAMAKVWAYPEDMPAIMRGTKAQGARANVVSSPQEGEGAGETGGRRVGAGGLDAAAGLAQIMPELLRSPNQYPIPLLPYLKVGNARASVVQRLTAAPGEPGGAVLAAATSVLGIQAWVSPLHVWHLMSVEATVSRILDYVRGSSFAESVAERRAEEAATAAAAAPAAKMPVPRPSRRLLVTLEVQEVSLLWLIGTWTSKGATAAGADTSRYSRAWGITVKRGDPAYLWAQWLAPVYGVSLAAIGAAVRLHPSGAVAAGASLEGVIVRDLQLPDGAKHAYVLRPLPARARRLNAWVQGVRRVLLGVASLSPARAAWHAAYRRVVLRQRTSLAHTTALLTDAESYTGFHAPRSVVIGPQLAVLYRATPAAGPGAPAPPGPPRPAAELRVEVGQMLAYVRVKQQASMTAFAQQMAQIATMITADTAGGAAPGGGAGAAAAPAPPAPAGGPALQSGLRVDVIVVGIDVLFRVESRDLMALKLQQGVVTVDRKPVTTASGPKDIRLHMSAAVQDVMVQDMRAAPEHSLVLIPNGDADYCSLDAIYTAQVDSRRYAPCLILEVNNPRVVLLFRFVADIMAAVGIISGAVAKKGAEAAPPPVAPVAPAPPPRDAPRPLEVVVQLQNAGVILPTSTATRTVLAANMAHVMLAVPGRALPSSLLAEAQLPGLDSIVEESLLCNTTYKYGGFHDGAAAGGGAADDGAEPPMSPTAAAARGGGEADGPGAVPVPAAPGVVQAPAAAAAEPAAAGAAAGGPDIKRAGLFGGRSHRDRRPQDDGVIYFEEDDSGAGPGQAGVLRVSLTDANANQVDNVLLGPTNVAKSVATATKRLAEDIVDAFNAAPEDWQQIRERAEIVIDHSAAEEAAAAGAGSSGGAGGGGGGAPGRPDSRESTAATSGGAARPAVPRGGDADSLAGVALGAGGGELPEPSMALVVEEFNVATGTLVRVPGYFRQQRGGAGGGTARQGSFVPAALASFSWPSQIYDVVPRSAFLHRCNLCLVMFERTAAPLPAAGPGPGPPPPLTSQTHISTTPLSCVMSGPTYNTLMDFLRGNMADLKGRDGGAPPAPPRRVETRFNPAMKFGPPPGAATPSRFTVAVPQLGVVLEAPAREWADADPRWEWVPASDAGLLRPFLHAGVSNLLLDVGSLASGDTHIKLCATSLDLQDLRLGYRLAEVSARVPQEEEAALAAPRPLQRYGMPLSAEERAVRAALFASGSLRSRGGRGRGGGATPPSVYASPMESPRSAASWDSADSAAGSGGGGPAGSAPFTPAAAQVLQAPGHNVAAGEAAAGALDAGSGGGSADSGGAVPTGIRLSVSRRLSEHSHRQRASAGPTPATVGPAPSSTDSAGGGGGGGTPHHFFPVLDFTEVPDVEEALGEDVASLRLLSAPHRAPPEERAAGTAAASTRLPGSNPNVRLEVSVALLADSTTAVEVALSNGILQWPYFQDLSLIWSIANVFKAATPEEREAVGDDAPPAPPPAPDAGPAPWLYVNAVLAEMEFFVPVLDVELAEHMAAELWGSGASGASSPGGPFSPARAAAAAAAAGRSPFQRVADLALATMLLDSTSAPGALALEERGLALSATVARFAYAAGGDGESSLRLDLRELAAFIRDPAARANCVLQPFSCSVEVGSQVPEAAEHLEVERLNRAAAVIQRHWRRFAARKALRTRIAGQAGGAVGAADAAVASYVVSGGRGRGGGGGGGGAARGPDDAARGRHWRLVDELVMDVASPHTRSLLLGYKRASRDRSQLMFLSQFLTVSTTVVRVQAGALTARAAFSHIPFWQTAVDGVQRVVLGVGPAGAGGSGTAPGSPVRGGAALRTPPPQLQRSTSDSAGRPGGAKPFRPHSLRVSAALENVAAVLCNDKPETFGAPDVLQLTFCEASLAYDAATMLPDRPANKAARLSLSTYASFLNSGTSRWEPLYDLWPVRADFLDIKSPMYLSDRKMNLWVSSDRHLNATFNPASLMSLGDALAFARAFEERILPEDVAAALPPTPSERRLTSLASASVGLTRPRAAATTVATTGAVTSRAPQKYLIQNQSGMRVYYWAESSSTAAAAAPAAAPGGARGAAAADRTPVYALDNGGSETLRVAPATKRLTFLQSSSAATGVERGGSVVSLHFEGNWMPIRDVAVNVVGKYRYSMVSPADNTWVPLVVDIILVGRTKVITLHSGIWVENSIGRPVSLRLHVPTTSLVPPQVTGAGLGGGGAGAPQVGAEGDLSIGPLAPKAGVYLPLTAALRGRLFLQPEGYREASRDVIRLSAEVDEVVGQQGYVSCDPLGLPGAGGDDGPLHVAMEATPSRVVSEFQAFKHMECVAPGTIQRATEPLEVTISIQPTMVIANALPYEMRVLLWQVPPPEAAGAPSVAEARAAREQDARARAAGRAAPGPLPAVTPGTAHQSSLFEMLSPRSSVAVPLPRRGTPGQYFCYRIPPGGEQDVHVDLRQNVLMHVSVEEINMRSVKWSLCSWAQRLGRGGGGRDGGGGASQYAARLPKEVQLRLVGVGMPLPTDQRLITPYLMRLKDAGAVMGAAHRQFNRDARTAVTSEDVKKAVGRVKALAKRMGKAGSGGRATTARHSPAAAAAAAVRAVDGADGGGPAPARPPNMPVPPRPRQPPMAPPPVQDGGVGKAPRRSWIMSRWASRHFSLLRRTTEAEDEIGWPPSLGRSTVVSTLTGGTPGASSPGQALLGSAGRPPRSSSANSAPAAVETELPRRTGSAEVPPAVAAAAAAAAAKATATAGGSGAKRAPPRPPPLEIAEADLEDLVDPATGMVPTPFDVWQQPTPPTPAGAAAGLPPRPRPAAAAVEEDQGAEARAPPVLHVGVHNSLADQKLEQAGVCRVTLFSPYWLNNRTGVDLFYRDYASAPTHPLLCGAALPGDYGEVFVPGTSMTQTLEREGGGSGAAGGSEAGGSGVGAGGAAMEQALLEYKLVLMNKQEEIGMGLAHVRRRKYGASVPIKTVGNKGGVELRGPPAVEPTRVQRVAEGIKTVAAGVEAVMPTAAVDTAAAIGNLLPSARAAAPPGAAAAGGRGLARHSVTRDTVADVVVTEPGTMLVRLTSSQSFPEDRRHAARRAAAAGAAGGSLAGAPQRVHDEDAQAALEAMQQLPASLGGPGERDGEPRSPRSPAKSPLFGEGPGGAAAASFGPAAAAAAAALEPGGTPAVAPPAEEPRADSPTARAAARISMMEAPSGQHDVAVSAGQAAAAAARAGRPTKGQRLFEFAVDVAAAPPDSIYSHTKLVTLKPKYIIENQTGLPVDVKQLGTRDPPEAAGGAPAVSARLSRTLAPGQRCAVYWDDAELPRELVVRPRPPGEAPDAWHWSGGFPIPETEWYFGLRIRQARGSRRYMNIPVNVTVGASGGVQVTLKSPASVPPYRIENGCKEVQLYFVQVPMMFREGGNLYVDRLEPGEAMPYAWDEPTLAPKLRVQAKVAGRPGEGKVSDFVLDRLGDAAMMMLPTHGGEEAGRRADKAGRIARTLSNDVPDELKKKLVSLLAAEFCKKVYVSVYADGPTRVLRFSDEKNASSLEQQHAVLDLAARLKQVEDALRAVNAQFARLSGVSGAHAWSLDLYGRMPAGREQGAAPRGALQRRASRRAPLPEGALALVQYASKHMPTVATAVRHGRSGSRDFSESPAASGALGPAPPGQGQTSSQRAATMRERDRDRPSGALKAPRSVSFAIDTAARPAPAGVLHLEEPDGGQGPLPYRHLVVRVDGEAELGRQASRSPSPEPAAGPSGSSPPSGRLRRSESLKDWGHITSDPMQSAGTRGLGRKSAAAPAGSADRGAPAAAPVAGAVTALAQRQERLREVAEGDAVLLIGGDLTVTVVQARHLSGLPRSTHCFARVRVADPVPPADSDAQERTKQTSVVWQSADPVWDEQLLFRDVCAASELVVELWDLGGTKSAEQLENLVANPAEVIKSCRFLGRAEVPLGETLDAPAGTPLWFPLARRTAADGVSGQLQLRFQWDVTARGLLAIKLAALERVLTQRREILAALQPVPMRTALRWGGPAAAEAGSPTKAASAAGGAALDLLGGGGAAADAGAGALAPSVQPSKVAAEILARHSLEHSRRHLVVTVLEARGLNPRRGVVVALSASELPNPVVTVSLPGHPTYATPAASHTLTPRWAADRRHAFRCVDPAAAALRVAVWDQRQGLLHRRVPLGAGAIHASHVRGENPVYVWVPLARPGRGAAAAAPLPGDAAADAAELQVFLRLQWQSEVERGSSLKVEVDAAGAGLMVVGGLQDELFNLTLDCARVTAVRSRLELTVEGSVAKVQLDNQMLNAVEPVVMAPDVSVRPTGTARDGPMVTIEFVRSYAGSAGGGAGGTGGAADPADVAHAAAEALAELEGGGGQGGLLAAAAAEAGALGRSASASASAGDLSGMAAEGAAADAGGARPSDARGIRSFKNIRLAVAPLDLMTDEAFLEAVLSFLSSLPTADVWQGPAWQEQQRRLLAAQFGPREVEGLAINAVVVPQAPPLPTGMVPGGGGLAPVPSAASLDAGSEAAAAAALGWVLEKEARDLDALHGQSDLSSWFFLESAEIATVAVNVTVSLSSRLLSAGQQLAGASGQFNRALGASGFQLVNVSNVPITLGRWVAGNDPSLRGRFSNGFLSQRALASNLIRHYARESLKEAHKVLGGAGPAVASVPLTVLWASSSAFVLVQQVSTGNAGLVGSLQQAFYIPLMSFSMFAGAFSKTLAAGMAATPPRRDDADDATLRRIIRRPNNAIEALAGAPKELVMGVSNAVSGLLMDPVAGWHEYGAAGFALGSAKALVGLPVRPFIGSLELTSKFIAAGALAVLGRDGIVGKMQRRVRAPGAYSDDGGDGAMEDGPRSEAVAHARALQAAWQRVLPEFFPEMAGDTVSDVINVRPTRVVLVTDRHVAYLRARHLREHSVYKAKWLVPAAEVQNIRGDPETRKITITHVHRYDLKVLGVWPVQKRKGLRCGSRATYERTVLRLTKVQQTVQGGGGGGEDAGAAGGGFVGADMAELTILSAPYVRPGAARMALPAGRAAPGAAGGAGPQAAAGAAGAAGPAPPRAVQSPR